MKLSVIVTVYNLARYVEASLASVFAQTQTPFEIIVVDDASTDGSVDRFVNDSRVTLVRHAYNRGVLRATISGIERATGDVLCFLDGDDVWEPNKLERIAAAFTYDVILCSHDCGQIDGNGVAVRQRDPEQQPTHSRSGEGRSAGMRRSILGYRGEVWLGSAWSIRSAALTRSVLQAWVASLTHPELVYQDHPLATLLLLTNPHGKLSYVPESLMRYRVHGANYSGGARDVARARSIVAKGRATRAATLALTQQYAAQDHELIERQLLMLREYDYLHALYDRDLGGALTAFVSCVRGVWSPRQSLKEALRLGAVSVLGPQRFFAMRSAQ